MAFYAYDQNNSGGYCVQDEVIADLVIIEAIDFEQANKIADKKGLFDYDYCECCGARFSHLYGETRSYKTVDEAIADDYRTNDYPEYKSYPTVRIHFLDGTVRRLHDR